jgi:hypothetical protein
MSVQVLLLSLQKTPGEHCLVIVRDSLQKTPTEDQLGSSWVEGEAYTMGILEKQ